MAAVATQPPVNDAVGAPPGPKVTRARPARRRFIAQIPPSITEDPELREAMGALCAHALVESPDVLRAFVSGAHSCGIKVSEIQT